MTALNWRLAALALLLGLLVGGRVAWQWQANDYNGRLAKQAEEHAQERAAAASAALDHLQAERAARAALEQNLQASSETHYKEMEDGKKERQRLRDRLATADVRLSVLVAAGAAEGGQCGVSAAASTGGVVYGPSRVELDPAHAQRIVGITGDGDDGLRALAACQDYARGVSRGRGHGGG